MELYNNYNVGTGTWVEGWAELLALAGVCVVLALSEDIIGDVKELFSSWLLWGGVWAPAIDSARYKRQDY